MKNKVGNRSVYDNDCTGNIHGKAVWNQKLLKPGKMNAREKKESRKYVKYRGRCAQNVHH